MDTNSNTQLIEPNMTLKAVLFLGLLIPMNVLGVCLLIQDSIRAVAGGMLAILFFGVGGFWAFFQMVRHRGPTFALSPKGLSVLTVPGSMLIPWQEIDVIAVYRLGRTSMPALKLRSYRRTLESLTPDGIAFMARGLKFLRVVSSSLTLVGSKDRSSGFGAASQVATFFKWNRDKCGYEISFSPFQLDRSPERFVDLLLEYQRRYHEFPSNESTSILPHNTLTASGT